MAFFIKSSFEFRVSSFQLQLETETRNLKLVTEYWKLATACDTNRLRPFLLRGGVSVDANASQIRRQEKEQQRNHHSRQALLPHRRSKRVASSARLRIAFLGDGVSAAQTNQVEHRAENVPAPRS